MNQTTENELPADSLYYYANKYIQEAIDEQELENQDFTEIFWYEVEQRIKLGNLANININGPPTMGKSTIAQTIGMQMLEIMKKHNKTYQKIPFGMFNIARDQQEYSMKMRDSNLRHTVLVTDEMNDLEEGGENVTVERQLNLVFSNIHAQRYVHRISCSPTQTTDPNSDILLEVKAAINGQTHCKLYFKMFKGGQEYTQLLGYVTINVMPLIKNWLQIREIFFKPNKTSAEQKIIDTQAKKDYYIEYMIKKHEKMPKT